MKDMKNYLSFSLFICLMAVGFVFAQETEQAAPAATSDIQAAETITTRDLGVENPGILPTSRFYFFKEWSRGFKQIFTFNPVKKAELELRIANQKAAELKKIEEISPQNINAIKKAVLNYEKSQERLKTKIEGLKETSQNPNVDELIKKIAERSIQHEKIFDEIEKKFEDKAEIKDLVEKNKEAVEKTLGAASQRDEPAKFAAKLEKILVESKGGEFKHFRSVEFLDQFSRKAPEDLKEPLLKLRDDFSEKAGEDIKNVFEKGNAEGIKRAIEDLPGDVSRRAVILEEIKRKTESADRPFAEAIGKTAEILDKDIEKREDIIQKAKEQIERAAELIQKLERILAGAPAEKAGLEAAKRHLDEAKPHLEKARAAFAENKFGDAFGLARSAEVLARQGLRLLEEKIITKKCGVNTFQVFEECGDGAGFKAVYVQCYDGFQDKRREDTCRSSEEWQKHARVLCANRCSIGPQPIPLPKPIEIKPIPTPISPKPIDETIICAEQYEPVCAANGKTYPNACYARRAGVEIKYKGECEEGILRPEILKPISPTLIPSVIPASPPTTAVETNVIAETFVVVQDGKFSPEVVKIKKGGKITWVNKSERAVWPASNPHPVHTDYAGFDAFHGLKTGESYSFVFERVGSWKYHDHLNPSVGGIIEVVE